MSRFHLGSSLLLLLALSPTASGPAAALGRRQAPALTFVAPSHGPFAQSLAPSANPRGIYVYSEHLGQDSAQLAQAIQLLGIDGVTLLYGWKNLEPDRGTYHWSTLDGWIDLAVTHGKKVILAIRAGGDTPCWLFGPAQCAAGSGKTFAGAAPLTFLVSARQGIGQTHCDTVTMAAPWDSVFQTQWDSMLTVLSAHLKTRGTYDDVVQVRLTGINRTTSELRLPEEILTTPCTGNAIETWLQAPVPYRPFRLLDAWGKITDSFLKHFSDKQFGLEVVPDSTGNNSFPFPEIDDSGCVYTQIVPHSLTPDACQNPGPLPDQNLPLILKANQDFQGRLSISFQNLDLRYPANPYPVNLAKMLGTAIGYQTNDYDSLQRAACGGGSQNPDTCDSASYLALLESGIYPLGKSDTTRALYIEVLPPDALAFPWSIGQAHLDLWAPGQTVVDRRVDGEPQLDLRLGHPNPFRGVTRLTYRLAAPDWVRLTVHDVQGHLVRVLDEGIRGAGRHEVDWDGTNQSGARVPTGVYLVRLQAAAGSRQRKILRVG